MKKSSIALAALSTLAGLAHAQSSVQIYGIVDAGFAYQSKNAAGTTAAAGTGSISALESGLLQSSRLGFRGTEDLGGGLKAIFGLEAAVAMDSGTATFFSRKSIVGLESPAFGSLQLGRRKDFLDEMGNDYGNLWDFGTFIFEAHAHNLDRVGGGSRANNMIYYNTPTWGGFHANVSYGFGETPNSISAGQSLGLGADYKQGPFAVGAGYWQSKKPAVGNVSSDNNAVNGAGCSASLAGSSAGDICIKTWSLGARYQANGLTVRGMWSQVKQPLIIVGAPLSFAATSATTFTNTPGAGAYTAGGSNNTKATVADISADFALGPWLLKAGYIQSRYDFVGASRGRLGQFTAGVEYYMSKRTTLYATGSAQRASGMYNPGILFSKAPGVDNSVSAFGLGLRHTF